MFLTRKTFTDSQDYEIIEEGFKVGHGHYYIYVFNMTKQIGVVCGVFLLRNYVFTFPGRKNLETDSRSYLRTRFQDPTMST